MRRIILHIGPHKTGSTYLQKQFCLHRNWLLEQGFSYPEFGQMQWGHHRLVEWLQNAAATHLHDAKRTFSETCATGCDIVLSSENFELLTLDQIKSLGELFDSTDFVIVYYARRWSGLLYSTWQENVKHGANETFPEFVCSHVARPFQSNLLNYANPLKGYRAVFGKDALRVISYDNLVSSGSDIFSHFVHEILSVHAEVEIVPEKINAAFQPELTELLRALNAIHYYRAGERTSATREAFLALKGRGQVPQLEKLTRVMETAKAHLYSGEGGFVNTMVLRRFLTEYGDRVINLTSSGALFDMIDDPAMEYVTQDYLLMDGVVPTLEEIYRATRNGGQLH